MQATIPLGERISARRAHMSPAEQRVASFFQEHRGKVLIESASALAERAGVSDATVIRAAKALGFAGMDELRRTLAEELEQDLSPVSRLARTLREVGDDLQGAFELTLDTHQRSLEMLRRDVSSGRFRRAVEHIANAQRVAIFGIGPSSAVAEYFAIQLGRFGIDSYALRNTGLLLADDIQKLREGDLLIAFAYSRVYRELAVLLDRADERGIPTILITDTLGGKLGKRVELVLEAPRGRANMLSMHTATIGLIETLLVGTATIRPDQTLSGLEQLNGLRTALVGKPMNLPTSPRDL